MFRGTASSFEVVESSRFQFGGLYCRLTMSRGTASSFTGVGAPFTRVTAAARTVVRVRRLTMLLKEISPGRKSKLELGMRTWWW